MINRTFLTGSVACLRQLSTIQGKFCLQKSQQIQAFRLVAIYSLKKTDRIYALQRFVRTLNGDLDAVRNAVTERWSNGQTEGQISRLKALKRAMYGRAGVSLLRARMMPLQSVNSHTT